MFVHERLGARGLGAGGWGGQRGAGGQGGMGGVVEGGVRHIKRRPTITSEAGARGLFTLLLSPLRKEQSGKSEKPGLVFRRNNQDC